MEERYVPRIFGFRVHEISKEMRLQDEVRKEMERRRRERREQVNVRAA